MKRVAVDVDKESDDGADEHQEKEAEDDEPYSRIVNHLLEIKLIHLKGGSRQKVGREKLAGQRIVQQKAGSGRQEDEQKDQKQRRGDQQGVLFDGCRQAFG